MVRRRSTVRFRNGAPQELPARPGQKLTGQLSSYAADGSCSRIGRNLGDRVLLGPPGDSPPGDLTVWVPTTLSLPSTWCLLLVDWWWSSSVSGCASAARSGTVGSRVATIRLFRGAQAIGLARLARPVRSCQGRRDPHPAPPGRRAPAPRPGAAPVVG